VGWGGGQLGVRFKGGRELKKREEGGDSASGISGRVLVIQA